ncbi:MAG: Flp pilus assembly complex ATPase component TadA [Armatimonadetes bacterium]|nr:Flp pilus assembly complex ATPase component TadA [Armatimonadota bacterium]
MSFRALCPFCSASYDNIEDSHQGDRARCRRCQQTIIIRPVTAEVQEAMQRARQLKVPFVRVAAVPLDPVLATSVPRATLQRYVAIPVGKSGDDLIVAMADPLDLYAVDALRLQVPALKAVMGLRSEIEQAVQDLPTPEALAQAQSARALAEVGGDVLAAQAIAELKAEFGEQAEAEAAAAAVATAPGDDDTSPAKKAVDAILSRAAEVQASEVRVMPHEGKIVVQGRTADGLHAIPVEDTVEYSRLVARLKTAAGADPSKRGIEQSGAIPFRHGGKEYEFLLSILPARDAERAVLRVLDAATVKQRRASERRQKIDELLATLAAAVWPPPGVRMDTSGAREFVGEQTEGKPPALRLALAIVRHAVDHHVRDLVVEPYGEGLRVLERSTAEHFEQVMTVPPFGQKPLLARMQIMANIDLTFTRDSRYGMFFLLYAGTAFEVRMATLPTEAGVIAILHFVKQGP